MLFWRDGNMSEGTVDSWKKRLQDILQRWAPENIWNIDETAQFFRALPGHVVARAERAFDMCFFREFQWCQRKAYRH